MNVPIDAGHPTVALYFDQLQISVMASAAEETALMRVRATPACGFV